MTAPESPAVVLRRAAERARRIAQTTRASADRKLVLKTAGRFEDEAARIEGGDLSNVDNALSAVRAYLGRSV